MMDSGSKDVALKDMLTTSLFQDQLPAAPQATKSASPKIRWDLLYPDEPVAITLVTQGYMLPGETAWKRRIGWVAVVNTAGQTVYDPFATYPKEDGLKKCFNSRRFEAAKEDLLFRRGARDGQEVERNLMNLLEGRTVIMHDQTRFVAEHFYFEQEAFDESLLYDTQEMYADLHADGTPSLYAAAREVLGEDIKRKDVHRPDQEAAMTMELYLRKMPYDREAKKAEWDAKGWTPDTSRRMAKKKGLSQSRDRVDSCNRPRTVVGVDEGLGPQSPSESPITLDAVAGFAQRLQRRHFADLRTHTPKE